MRDRDRQQAGRTSLLSLAALTTAAAELILPLMLGAALDSAIARDADPRWFAGCALIVAMAIVGEVVATLSAGVSRVNAAAELRRRLIRQLLGIGLLFFVHPWLGCAAIVGCLLSLGLRVRDRSGTVDDYRRAHSSLVRPLLEAAGGMRTIVAARTQAHEARRVLSRLPELRRCGQARWQALARVSAVSAVSRPLTELSVLAAAGALLSSGSISAGDLVAALRYAGLCGGLGVATAVLLRRPGRAAEPPSTPTISYGTRHLPCVSAVAPGRLEFHAVTCLELRELTLTVPSGLSVAVVGEGAPTLAALSARLLEPESGRITLDGVDLPDLTRTALREAVGYAFARPAMLGHTLHDVIALGPRPVDRPAVVAAARVAGADGFIRRLPEGYDTAADRAPLSAGEVQRLGLARVFAHPGRVLIFDDVVPGLDCVTELQVRRVITSGLAGRTRLIVASSAATAARADLVAWLDGGGVRALGEHATLWRDPAYRAVFGVSAPGRAHRFAVRRPSRKTGAHDS